MPPIVWVGAAIRVLAAHYLPAPPHFVVDMWVQGGFSLFFSNGAPPIRGPRSGKFFLTFTYESMMRVKCQYLDAVFSLEKLVGTIV